ncbi:hypothetical protein [Hydrogenophaga sp.]|uniref:hypothetical protein n=1 Tax=Hydrogenophaga sp. TaxID=1904254 RepID=UPI0025B890E5|nr:hypothetical protein [Hydrogenophaga sp.]
MKKLITLIALSSTAFLTAYANPTPPVAGPASTAGGGAHADHHPATAAAPAPSTPAPAAPAAMDERMKNMQAMRDKMMNAKTPAERQALMDEHMKSMHEGMAMMKGMQGMGNMQVKPGMAGMKDMPMKDMAKHHQAMAMHMEMMQTMMEMMMQRMPGAAMPPAGK